MLADYEDLPSSRPQQPSTLNTCPPPSAPSSPPRCLMPCAQLTWGREEQGQMVLVVVGLQLQAARQEAEFAEHALSGTLDTVE